MRFARFFQLLLLVTVSSFVVPAQALQVTVTIPPLAGMIAPLLDEDDKIEVLLKPGVSPHGFQLKPSHLRILSKSDLLITAGSPVDAWVNKYAQRVAANKIRLADLTAIEKLPVRKGGLWERKPGKAVVEDEHGDHDDHDQHDHHGHDELNYDGHIWMSMNNARQAVRAASEWLQKQQPQKASAYRQREADWLAKLDQQDRLNRQRLQTVQDQAFFVLHDAFQYFEHHYQLKGVGSVRLNPEIPPSLKRLSELREKIQHNQVKCVFQEPQFPSKQMQRLTEGTDTKIGSLDPMGTSYLLAKKGTGSQKNYLLYDRFSAYLTDSFMRCLAD